MANGWGPFQLAADSDGRRVLARLRALGRAEVFATIGVTNIRTFVNPQNRNSVALIMDVPDLDAMMAMLQSDEGKAAEEYDGVLAETIAIFIEE